ncbi:hypothetical protein MHBO_001730 [Bonamia ostreae]|uniref:Ribosomal protein L29 n=1 Tax=Bonamia ostreae TaxID=126728 RepID=A0ABV2AJY9_9EUKA
MAAIKPIEMAEKFNLDPTQIKILKEKVCCARLKLENDSKKEFNRKITKICINAKKIISLRRSVKRVVNWIDHKTNESNFINSKKTENNYKNRLLSNNNSCHQCKKNKPNSSLAFCTKINSNVN